MTTPNPQPQQSNVLDGLSTSWGTSVPNPGTVSPVVTSLPVVQSMPSSVHLPAVHTPQSFNFSQPVIPQQNFALPQQNFALPQQQFSVLPQSVTSPFTAGLQSMIPQAATEFMQQPQVMAPPPVETPTVASEMLDSLDLTSPLTDFSEPAVPLEASGSPLVPQPADMAENLLAGMLGVESPGTDFMGEMSQVRHELHREPASEGGPIEEDSLSEMPRLPFDAGDLTDIKRWADGQPSDAYDDPETRALLTIAALAVVTEEAVNVPASFAEERVFTAQRELTRLEENISRAREEYDDRLRDSGGRFGDPNENAPTVRMARIELERLQEERPARVRDLEVAREALPANHQKLRNDLLDRAAEQRVLDWEEAAGRASQGSTTAFANAFNLSPPSTGSAGGGSTARQGEPVAATQEGAVEEAGEFNVYEDAIRRVRGGFDSSTSELRSELGQLQSQARGFRDKGEPVPPATSGRIRDIQQDLQMRIPNERGLEQLSTDPRFSTTFSSHVDSTTGQLNVEAFASDVIQQVKGAFDSLNVSEYVLPEKQDAYAVTIGEIERNFLSGSFTTAVDQVNAAYTAIGAAAEEAIVGKFETNFDIGEPAAGWSALDVSRRGDALSFMRENGWDTNPATRNAFTRMGNAHSAAQRGLSGNIQRIGFVDGVLGEYDGRVTSNVKGWRYADEAEQMIKDGLAPAFESAERSLEVLHRNADQLGGTESLEFNRAVDRITRTLDAAVRAETSRVGNTEAPNKNPFRDCTYSGCSPNIGMYMAMGSLALGVLTPVLQTMENRRMWDRERRDRERDRELQRELTAMQIEGQVAAAHASSPSRGTPAALNVSV